MAFFLCFVGLQERSSITTSTSTTDLKTLADSAPATTRRHHLQTIRSEPTTPTKPKLHLDLPGGQWLGGSDRRHHHQNMAVAVAAGSGQRQRQRADNAVRAAAVGSGQLAAAVAMVAVSVMISEGTFGLLSGRGLACCVVVWQRSVVMTMAPGQVGSR